MPDRIPDDEPCPEPLVDDLDPDDLATDRLPSIAPGLVLVSTPIGNLADMSQRALEALRHADLVLCEDTRTTAHLLMHYGITVRTSPLHDHNEEGRIPALLDTLRGGGRVALVSDAGTPLVSDPGYRLVRAALAAGLPVSAVPGPNAALMALILSGLPPQPFLFLGFPPPRSAARLAAFGKLRAAERAGLSATLLWHEAPHRLAGSLADLAAQFGDRPACRGARVDETLRGGAPRLAARTRRALRRHRGTRGDHDCSRPGARGRHRRRRPGQPATPGVGAE